MKKTLFFLLALVASPGLAQQDPVLALRAASQEIDAATTALTQAELAEDRVAALSSSIRSLESGLSSLRLALRASMLEAEDRRAAISENRIALGNLLAMLISLQNTPAALTLLHPDGATASARAGIILASITPEMREKAQQLRNEIATINALNSLHADALENVQTALQTLQSARGELAASLRESRPPPANPLNVLQNLEQLVRASEDLNGLATRLSASLPPASPIAANTARSLLPLPVTGHITRGFNRPNAAGIRQPGIVVTAAPLSLVLAPQGGIVRFAGEFLEYGQVVILEPAPQQLQIYAGFGQVYVRTGEVLELGAAMGLLGGEMPESAEFLVESTGENDNSNESLYIEIRENGVPVDPSKWFAAN